MSQRSRRSSRKAKALAEYKVDKATMFIFYISLASIVIEVVVHLGDLPTFAQQYMIFLAFEASIIVVTRTKMLNIVEPKEINWFTVGWTAAVGVIALFAVQIIIGYLARVKLALAPWEIYLFYVNAALAEECLYRATMITFLDKIFVKMPYFNEQPVVRKLVLVVASASVFGMSHYWVYGQQPALMLTAFIGGLVLALVYVIAKHPLPPVIAHVINNMAASYQTIQSMSVVSVAAVFTPVAVPFVAIAWLAIGIVIVARGKTRKRPVLEGIETVI